MTYLLLFKLRYTVHIGHIANDIKFINILSSLKYKLTCNNFALKREITLITFLYCMKMNNNFIDTVKNNLNFGGV